VAARFRPDIMQIEFTHMAAYRDAARDVPAILAEHDLTYTLYSQLAKKQQKPQARREFERWLKFERHWLRTYTGVWTVAEEDRQQVLTVSQRDPRTTFTVPNGVDVERFLPSEDAGGMPQLLFVGAFRHLPNVMAFEKLRCEIMPRVWSRFPSVKLRVVAGPRYEDFCQRKPEPRIEIDGFVDDLRPLYRAATVIVAPLEVSAGTNIKVLEALACGKALVTTTVGAAGLGLKDWREVLIRDNWSEFGDAICDLLESRELRSRLGREARQAAEDRFSWAEIARRAYESYETVAGRNSSRSRLNVTDAASADLDCIGR
jgi:glycosyltransferase involved in cell wall biosynthesis